MATSHPHVPAAFINAIAEEGTKAEAIEYLQKTWNELCALQSSVAQRPELTHSPALEHRADGYFRPASLRTIIARAALAVIEKPDGVETLDWQIADAVIAMLPKSLAPQPGLEPTIGKYRADYLPVTAEEIAKEDPELTELYAHSRPALDSATVEALAQRIYTAPGLYLSAANSQRAANAVVSSILEPPDLETLAKTIRGALIEDWENVVDGSSWREDVLLTGCKKVGGGLGYKNPEEAAQNLALDAAKAIRALASPAPSGGPVAWRVRKDDKHPWAYSHRNESPEGYEIEPLYAAPCASKPDSSTSQSGGE